MATAAVPNSNLLDMVHCQLCLEKYNDSDRLPKLLNCSHTFCLACVQRYCESNLKNKLACPNCRKEFIVHPDGVQNLNTNIMAVNLLDHLAPFTAVDTDEGVVATFVPKDKIPEEPDLTICGLHPGEKCDFYCDDCRDPLCADCMVSLSEGPHKTHKIRKLRDVLTTYSTQHKDDTEVTKPKVRKQTHNQPGFRLLSDLPMQPDCHWRVGLTTNEAVVGFDDRSIIKKIKFDGNQIIVLKQSALPHNISAWHEKYILNNNDVLLRGYDKGPSYILNSQLELVSTIQEDYGKIIGAESIHWVAFHKDEVSIDIYDLEQKQLLDTLIRPGRIRWYGNMSACRHPDSQFTAVVSYGMSSLYIYDHEGHHLRTISIRQPLSSHTIACNRHHLYVLEQRDPVAVSVHSWSSHLMVTRLLTEQLSIPDGEKIGDIAVGEDQFTIAVGHQGSGSVHSIKTFQCV